MLQYLIILLDDTSTSFCHYTNPKTERRLIGLDTLKAAIRFAMVENLTIQFVYPDYPLPQEHLDLIDTIDHTDIAPHNEADVTVVEKWPMVAEIATLHGRVVVLRSTLTDLLQHGEDAAALAAAVQRLNIVVTDTERLTEADQTAYAAWLRQLSTTVEQCYADGASPQVNALTDRLMLTAMNNCGAGDTCLTLAPNGHFYVCPAFYYDNEADCVGDLDSGPNLPNRQLYRLDHAPICRHCDAYQCRRCVWLNRKTTLEVNTPSHEQCVAAHLERNAARDLQQRLRQRGTFLPDKPAIPEVEYLDPFNKANKWN